MKFTDWLALPQLSSDVWHEAKFDHAFDNETRVGYDTWPLTVYMCNLCCAAVLHLNYHEQWHRDLGR